MGDGGNATQSFGSGTPDSTSTSLLAAARAGDARAWEQLVEIYSPLVYQWCRHCNLRPDDAADAAQDTFLAVLTGLDNFRRERTRGSFRGWLCTIALNKIRDIARRRRGLPPAQGGTGAQAGLAQIPEPDDPSAQDLTGHFLGSAQRRALESVRASVEPQTWEAFWRVTALGRDPADVAQELGWTVKAVYDANYRVRRKLRRELDGLLE